MYGKHFDAAVAIGQCLDQLEGAAPRLLLVFCGGKHAPDNVLGALQGALGDVPVVGGSAAGGISREGFGYSGLEIAIVAFLDPAATPAVFTEDGLDRDIVGAGRALGRKVAARSAGGEFALLLHDSVASNPPLVLHPASLILKGFNAGLGGKRLSVAGGGLLTDINLSDGWVFDGAGVRKHVIIALLFPPSIEAEIVVLHGCRPVSTFMQITRMDGAEIFELDGQPALQVLEQMLHLPMGGMRESDISLIATLGRKHGDPYAPYDENAYVNRLILRVDRAAGSLTLFEPDFEAGTPVQIMARDNALMLESVRSGAAAMNARLGGTKPLLGLYIDCAGRASVRSGAQEEEAAVLVRAFRRDVPLLGFYSGVEMAPMDGVTRPLDWTAVLAVLRYRM